MGQNRDMNRLILILIITSLASVLSASKFAYAGSACTAPTHTGSTGADVLECSSASSCMTCVDCCSSASVQQISQDYFKDYRKDFIMDSFYTCPVETNFQQVADEMRNILLLRFAAIGAFIDASILNDTLREVEVLTTDTLKSYAPSDQICRFGTLSRALAGSESKVDTDRLVLSEVGLAKNLGKANTISAAGRGEEFQARLRVFADKFCDLKDNETGMSGLCPSATPSKDTDLNRDVDYARLLANGVTINADMTDNNNTKDEASLFTLGHFLYGHKQPLKRSSVTSFNETPGSLNAYNDYRSIVARRAAAQNTYNTLAAMKMAGSGGSETYMRQVLKQIGISGNAADRYLGATETGDPVANSSYNAQMNLLTKQIYQDPAFYANLMESRTNVKRTSASLQALGLMQGRDIYKSMARSEMLAAILVELEARKISNNIQGMGN